MALKVIRMRSKVSIAKKKYDELFKRSAEFEAKENELKTAYEQAENENDLAEIETAAEEFETEKTQYDNDLAAAKSEMETATAELKAAETEAAENKEKEKEKEKATAPKERSKGEIFGMKVNKYETRTQMLERINERSTKEFYNNVRDIVLKKRSVKNTDLTIPQNVVNMIDSLTKDYSILAKLVNFVPLTGEGRIIVDAGVSDAVWTEMCADISELDITFEGKEVDGYKISGFVPLCNANIEDSAIQLANLVETRLAQSIAKGIDKAIISGEGAAKKQPLGVINATDVNKVTTAADFKSFYTAYSNLGVKGDDELDLNEVTAVMKRSTYFKHFVPQLLVPTSDGRMVVPNLQTPYLPDGTKVVFLSSVPDDTVVVGDYSRYLLVERGKLKIDQSEHVQFLQDNTVFRGTARYDGLPAQSEAFVVITLEDGADGTDGEMAGKSATKTSTK